jgi:hypothetical protein
MKTRYSFYIKIYSIILIFTLLSCKLCWSQKKINEIFPHIINIATYDSVTLCLTKDENRLNDPNRFYSLFLLYNYSIIDSTSLDQFSNSGAHPKSLFIWNTSNRKYTCLEYNQGSGVGHQLIEKTNLFIFDLSKRKIERVLTTVTDSLEFNTYSNLGMEVNSRIIPYKDTLFIIREGWKEYGKNEIFKKKIWESSISIILQNNMLVINKKNGLPYFMEKHQLLKKK